MFVHPTFYVVRCSELRRIHNAQVYYNPDNQLLTSYLYQIQNYNPHPPHHNLCLHNLNLHTALTRAKPLMNLLMRLLSNQPQKKHSSKPLTVLSRPNSNMPSKVKLQEPDLFDSSDSRKLHTFILQCKLNFQDRPDLFKDNSTN